MYVVIACVATTTYDCCGYGGRLECQIARIVVGIAGAEVVSAITLGCTFQVCALSKHLVVVVLAVDGGEDTVHIDGPEFATTIEHLAHIGDIGRVEIRKVEFGQFVAVVEHLIHVGDILCIEILQSLNVLEIVATSKPLSACSGIIILETQSKRYSSDLTFFTQIPCPCWRFGITLLLLVYAVAPIFAFGHLTFGGLSAIFEGQCFVGVAPFHERFGLYERKAGRLNAVSSVGGVAHVAYFPTEVLVCGRTGARVCDGRTLVARKPAVIADVVYECPSIGATFAGRHIVAAIELP